MADAGGDALRRDLGGSSLQRAVGELRVSAKLRGEDTVLEGLRQAGCLRARFPRRVMPEWLDVVTLNTSGGIAGGDRLDLAIDVAAGGRVIVAAQAAERFYRRIAGGGPSVVRNGVAVGKGAAVEWLPQETILFDGCGLDRRLDVSVTGDARFLGVETLVFGRAAMGEVVREAWVRDLIRVRRDGTLLLHDAVRLDGPVETLMRRAALANGGAALGTVVYVAPDAESRLEAVRLVLGSEAAGGSSAATRLPAGGRSHGAEAAASAWSGMLITRIVASDGTALRRVVVGALAALRDGRPLPRVWMC